MANHKDNVAKPSFLPHEGNYLGSGINYCNCLVLFTLSNIF
ncbi:MAG: hypothetical protein UV51_C0007G0004 [Candidatus Woesebacteria bacterium GW2011_GWC1_42_9]|nr:MAG: hypothetical protein UV51_C0007G0004 [Candidatus Woesebacteria bacterium GW2011_GWC1_42_9]